MPISRRIFLRAGTAVVLGATAHSVLGKMIGKQSGGIVEAVSGFRVPAGSMSDPLTFYSKATFTAHLNSKFRLRLADASNSTVVTLVKVTDFAPLALNRSAKLMVQAGKGECFSLVFSGAKQLPQDTYIVEHGALGTFRLLLVPSAKSGAAPQWEAVINRLYS